MAEQGRSIALVSPRFAPYIGGVERHVEKIACGLLGRGYVVEVVTTDPSHELPPVERRDGLTVRRFPTAGRGQGLLFAPSLGSWLTANASRYQILHAHSYHAPPAMQSAIVSRLTGVPLVITTHFHGTSHYPSHRWIHDIYRPMARMAFNQARALICVTESERRLVDSLLRGRTPIFVIPSGADLDEADSVIPWPKRPGTRLVIVVARLEKYKQVDHVVESLIYLPSNYNLVVVGQGPAREGLESLAASLGVSDRLQILQDLSRPALISWYLAADVAVSISLMEAQGLTIMEAVGAGCPMVLSDIPAHREAEAWVPPGCLSFVAADAHATDIASSIQAAAGGNRCEASKVRTWDRTLDDLIACYDYVLERSSATEPTANPAGKL